MRTSAAARPAPTRSRSRNSPKQLRDNKIRALEIRRAGSHRHRQHRLPRASADRHAEAGAALDRGHRRGAGLSACRPAGMIRFPVGRIGIYTTCRIGSRTCPDSADGSERRQDVDEQAPPLAGRVGERARSGRSAGVSLSPASPARGREIDARALIGQFILPVEPLTCVDTDAGRAGPRRRRWRSSCRAGHPEASCGPGVETRPARIPAPA